MKVAIDINNKKIVDILPENISSTSKFIIKNNYEILDISDPILNKEVDENGVVTIVFRELLDSDILLIANKNIIKEIVQLENSLLRPVRELLSTSSTQEQKDKAQVKINQIEEQIQELRSRMV